MNLLKKAFITEVILYLMTVIEIIQISLLPRTGEIDFIVMLISLVIYTITWLLHFMGGKQ